METKTDTLDPRKSLDLITSMIAQAKGNARKASFYFLVWGWTIVVANLGVYGMIRYTDVENPYIMFVLTIPAAIASVIYGTRQNKAGMITTHLDQIHKWLWIGFGINCFLVVLVGKHIGWMVNPVIITMCALPTFVTGIMLKFKPLIVGGVVLWVAGTALFYMTREHQFLFAALAIALGYLVPGYLLKNSEK